MTHPADAAGHPAALPFVAAIGGLLVIARSLREYIWPSEEPRRKRTLGPGPKPR
jgi:hypothetical protein